MKKFALCMCLFAAVLLVATGCAPKEKRCALSGSVTLDGAPVPSGVLNFIPLNADPSKGTVGGSCQIVDGAYAMDPKHGSTLLPGEYKVVVNASFAIDKKTNEPVDVDDIKDGLVDPNSVEFVDALPAKYSSASELTVTVTEEKLQVYDITMTKE